MGHLAHIQTLPLPYIALNRYLKIILECTVFVLLSADVVRYNAVHYMLTLALYYYVTNWQLVWIVEPPFCKLSATM